MVRVRADRSRLVTCGRTKVATNRVALRAWTLLAFACGAAPQGPAMIDPIRRAATGFWCTASRAFPANGLCLRDEGRCTRERERLLATGADHVADLEPCAPRDRAFCHDDNYGRETCAQTASTCDFYRHASSSMVSTCTERR